MKGAQSKSAGKSRRELVAGYGLRGYVEEHLKSPIQKLTKDCFYFATSHITSSKKFSMTLFKGV